VIGPIFSANALKAAAVANARSICLISPTANANGIAATGPYVFQANPDFEQRGRAMARYAVGTRGLKTLAILVSTEGNGRFMADAFLKEATDLGARVIATELYERGASDLKVQLGNIRRAGLLEMNDPLISFAGKVSRADIARLVQVGVPARRIDSLVEHSAVIRASKLLGPQARRKIDSVGIRTMATFIPLDSLATPLTTIDGIYVPIASSDEIGIVSSQIVYFNLQTQVLGSGEWNNLPELSAQKRYCTGVIFESESYFDERDSTYLEISRRYSERFSRRPTKYVFFGYDTARLLWSLIQKGGASRDGLARTLKTVENFQGLHAKIGFPPGRVNPWLHILQFDGEKVLHIGEVNGQPGKL
jgi:ABC-type branched-subunit amino acid transport system substrate-binding protein